MTQPNWKEYTIYYLRRIPDNLIFYIGKTEKPLFKRLAGHWSDVRQDKSGSYKHEIMNDCHHRDIEIVEIEFIKSIHGADCNREKFWIQQFMRHGYKLANKTDYVNNYHFKYDFSPTHIQRIGNINCPFHAFIYHSFVSVKDYTND